MRENAGNTGVIVPYPFNWKCGSGESAAGRRGKIRGVVEEYLAECKVQVAVCGKSRSSVPRVRGHNNVRRNNRHTGDRCELLYSGAAIARGGKKAQEIVHRQVIVGVGRRVGLRIIRHGHMLMIIIMMMTMHLRAHLIIGHHIEMHMMLMRHEARQREQQQEQDMQRADM
ncbi:MAG: hypothetical protein RRA94_04730 [Bacteroidota bacterium]|nr:hypothetical protein [Bacteroidota bacterium]